MMITGCAYSSASPVQLPHSAIALAAQAQQLDAQADHQAELAGLTTAITAFCQRVRTGLTHATFAQKRTLVELLIDRVVVTNDEVEIRYVILISTAGEHTRFCHLRKDYSDGW
jgi:site-specific DNA recombinase